MSCLIQSVCKLLAQGRTTLSKASMGNSELSIGGTTLPELPECSPWLTDPAAVI